MNQMTMITITQPLCPAGSRQMVTLLWIERGGFVYGAKRGVERDQRLSLFRIGGTDVLGT